jgi:hypothetical protein
MLRIGLYERIAASELDAVHVGPSTPVASFNLRAPDKRHPAMA